MGQISLQIMTRELCHDLYKGWTNDASIYMDMKLFKPYTYNEDAVIEAGCVEGCIRNYA